MKVKQIFETLNSMCNDILGKPNYLGSDGKTYFDKSERFTEDGTKITYGDASWSLAEDLSNIVDIGKTIFDATAVDNYVSKLIDHIGRVIFVNRSYSPIVPSLMKDGWEYGSILEKIDADMPESISNPKWELENDKVYEQDKFNGPKGVRAKFFNDAITFQVRMSFTEDQVKESFSSVSQLNGFFSMIETKIKNRMAIDYGNLIRATMNSAIAATVYNEANSLYSSSTHKYTWGDNSYIRCVNLLAKYHYEGYDPNDELTKDNCLKNIDFLKYCAYTIMMYVKHMRDISTLFNIGKKERFTPTDLQHLVLLTEFAEQANVYLQSITFHNEFVKLPNSETVNFWQGTGSDYSFKETSKIHVVSKVSADGNTWEAKETIVDGVIGILFDNDMMGVCNEKNKTTSHYNANGDFINNFYKSFAKYFNDFDENCVVFLVA